MYINNILASFLNKNDILRNGQHGFRPKILYLYCNY